MSTPSPYRSAVGTVIDRSPSVIVTHSGTNGPQEADGLNGSTATITASAMSQQQPSSRPRSEASGKAIIVPDLSFDPGDGFGPLPYFYHRHNCGLKTSPRRTERTVELPIADRWLSSVDPANLVELGAVTPYYWPGRIARVIDPADPKATERASLFDVDLTGRDVLSISTIEHVGERRYGLAEERSPLEAVLRIADQARRLLVTFPSGWHTAGAKRLEWFTLNDRETFARQGIEVRILARWNDEVWTPSPVTRPYGDKRKPWANAIIILER